MSPRVVTDTSAFLAIVLNEPSRAQIIEATKGCNLLAPSTVPSEIGNALSAAFKRNRLTLEVACKALRAFQRIPVRFEDVSVKEALVLAHKLGLYAYDAYVLHCAASQKTPLLTLDGGLIYAANRLGIPVIRL